MMFRIEGITLKEHIYNEQSELLFTSLYRKIMPDYLAELKRYTGRHYPEIENINKALLLLKCNVPAIDFNDNPKAYILKVMDYLCKK